VNFPAFGEPGIYAFWAFWLNNGFAHHGACAEELTQGAKVVFVAQCFATGAECPNANAPEHFLTSTAPSASVVEVGGSVSVSLGSVATSTGEPEALPSGVTVSAGSSSANPNAQGVAVLTLPSAGTYAIQAHAPGSVPSDPYTVCVHNGNDGTCGTSLAPAAAVVVPPPPPPAVEVARVTGITNGQIYSRRHAPRLLAGVVQLSGGATLRDVRIRIQRRLPGRCFDFSGSRAEFVRSRHCAPPAFFSVGAAQSFTYLLPAKLPRGRYTYDIEAIDATGQATSLSAVSHVVFRVR
jgi:hypothetical protein